jgi:hypothetical protein
VQYLVHSAFFHSDDEIASSKPGTKHLVQSSDARDGSSVNEAEIHLRNAPDLFKQTEPPLARTARPGLSHEQKA